MTELFGENFVKNLKDTRGIVMERYNINNRRYANSTILTAYNEYNLHNLLDSVIVHNE